MIFQSGKKFINFEDLHPTPMWVGRMKQLVFWKFFWTPFTTVSCFELFFFIETYFYYFNNTRMNSTIEFDFLLLFLSHFLECVSKIPSYAFAIYEIYIRYWMPVDESTFPSLNLEIIGNDSAKFSDFVIIRE